jgi:hypothetical protein
MALGHASSECKFRSPDLTNLALLRLHEHSEQDDSPTRRDPVRNPCGSPVKEEPKFSQLAVQLACERLLQLHSHIGETINVELNATLRCFIERAIPIPNLGLEFHTTP